MTDRWFLTLTAWLVAGCAGMPTVARVVEGRIVEGPEISPETYAAALRAGDAEARGDLETAEREWRLVVALGDDAAPAWARLGAVLCRAGRPGADQAFDRAAALEPALATVPEERARCALSRGRADDAVRAALLALALDPLRVDVSVLAAHALEAAGRAEDARRVVDGALVLWPRHGELQALAARFRGGPAVSPGAGALRGGGSTGTARAVPWRPPGPRPSHEATTTLHLEAIDAALRRGDLREARQLAARGRVDAAALALRACLVAAPRVAIDQATLAVGAEPARADAWVALAHARALARDTAGVTVALRGLEESERRLSATASRLLVELVLLHAGRSPARALLEALSPAPPADPIEREHASRLAARLAGDAP